ncbi:hypothetical protein JCGZ_10043 [Jatropha curcas]|uniref:Uncharacterized protein n=1 Tax=Jatropha curcas TaxID=180498 RepID=A0A067LG16_JATCU|nr:hypothetical protein JCGZ_10043 [Jatropha curcas]
MGLIFSSQELTSLPTAKLIFKDGHIEEFPYPIRVSHLLQRNPNCFICNTDDMDYDNYIPAIDGDKELQLGQIYFALPVSWLKIKLQPPEMAALAVKASLALQTTGGRPRRIKRQGIKRVDPNDGAKIFLFKEEPKF